MSVNVFVAFSFLGGKMKPIHIIAEGDNARASILAEF